MGFFSCASLHIKNFSSLNLTSLTKLDYLKNLRKTDREIYANIKRYQGICLNFFEFRVKLLGEMVYESRTLGSHFYCFRFNFPGLTDHVFMSIFTFPSYDQKWVHGTFISLLYNQQNFGSQIKLFFSRPCTRCYHFRISFV